MRRSKIFRGLYLLVLAVFAVSGAALAVRSAELRQGNEFYAQLGEAPPPAAPPVPSAPPAAPEPVPEPAPDPLSLRLVQFAGDYPDAVLWLQLPDTSLDYPVMLGADNQFYLNHLPDGSKNALGSLFLDCRTCADGLHLIVYGHNGAGGKMFGLLKQYESPDYYSAHPALTIAAPDAVYVCPVFSVRRVEADGDAYQPAFADRDSLLAYLRQAAAESLYQTGADPADAAGVLTLSTCTGRRSQRLLVQALLPQPVL